MTGEHVRQATRSLLFVALVVLATTVCHASAFALPLENKALRIGVLTMGPGSAFYERFGHDALVVLDTRSGEAISYNFGFFDPTEPGFIKRFWLGQMQYALVAIPLRSDLEQYQHEGRSAQLQWLNLSPAQAKVLAGHLALLSRPDYSRYHYNYLTANCATKVRDSLNQALGGRLARQTTAVVAGAPTYRMRILALAGAAPWMEILLDIGLGPTADQPLTLWQDMFLPAQLAQHLNQINTQSGHPLVEQTVNLLDPQYTLPVKRYHPSWWWLAGSIFAAFLLALARHPRLHALISLCLWLICAVVGWLLVCLWVFTDHQVTWMNANILLFNPVCLAVLVDWTRLWKRQAAKPWISFSHWLIAGSCLAALAMHIVQTHPQDNSAWIGFLTPIHSVQLYLCQRRNTQTHRRTGPLKAQIAATRSAHKA